MPYLEVVTTTPTTMWPDLGTSNGYTGTSGKLPNSVTYTMMYNTITQLCTHDQNSLANGTDISSIGGKHAMYSNTDIPRSAGPSERTAAGSLHVRSQRTFVLAPLPSPFFTIDPTPSLFYLTTSLVHIGVHIIRDVKHMVILTFLFETKPAVTTNRPLLPKQFVLLNLVVFLPCICFKCKLYEIKYHLMYVYSLRKL